jgi:endonuclease/exonuclease/phosphatase family metal-dependent hydrolase
LKGRTFVRKVLFAVNIIFAIGLVSSSLAHLVDPNTFLVPSFLGLAFLPFLAINSIAFIFWLFAKFRNSWLSLAAMLLALPSITTHLAFSNAAESTSSDIKVMSYNVRLFDLYNWSSNKKTRNLILDYFTQEDADIICIQEFFNSNDNSYFNTLDSMLKVQNAKNVHDEYTAILHKGRSKFGIATFSKFPIKNRQIVQLDTSGNNIAIFTDIETDQGMLRVFNVHLASVHLSSMEKDINEHIEKSDQSKQWNDVKVMSRKLAGGFKKRANQAKVIRSYIEQSPYPVIICGDFNDTPSSFAYHTIRNDFQDAFLTKGSGLGASYIGFIPSLRIDYVMCDSNFTINQFTQSNVKLSDHKPAIAQISLKAKTN